MTARRKAVRLSAVVRYGILLTLLIFELGPLAILGFNSLKSTAELGRNPIGLPSNPVWSNFPNAWEEGGFSRTTRNSAILVAGTVALVLLFAGPASYSLSKRGLPGSDAVTLYFLVATSLPLQLFLVPLFILWRSIGLVNNLFGVILIYTAINSPLAIFLLRSYMVQVPSDFEDAARVDGASEWAVFFRVVMPISWPRFLTVGLVTALSVWNEFLIATVFLTRQSLFTVVTSYYAFTTRFSRDWGLTSAAAVMMILPIILIFLSLQRQFIEGLTQGGLKA